MTLVDGIALARAVFHHSINYRSAVIFGTARVIDNDPERLRGLRAVVEHVAPGQWAAAREPARKELAATAVLAVPVAEAPVKIRSGPPVGDPEDYGPGVWAGVLPVRMTFGVPQPDPALPAGTAVPAHVRERM